MQYRWIDQLAKAQRQRTRANLSAALSGVESDFDIEITRAFLAFQIPFSNVSYADRYEEWLRDAPYPGLVRGVYLMDPARSGTLPKPVVAQEPTIRRVEWGGDFQGPTFQVGGTAASVAAPVAAPDEFQVFSTRAGAGALVSAGPEIIVDGNPALAFPVPLPAPPRRSDQVIVRAPGPDRPFQATQIVTSGGRMGPPQWVLVVFDAKYLRLTFLPALVERYFRSSSASEFDVIAVDRNRVPSSVVFPAQSDSIPKEFEKPDGRVQLFQLRLDCFSAPSSLTPTTIAASAGGAMDVLSPDRLSVIWGRKSTTCSDPAPSLEGRVTGSWELLAKYRAGSVDEAIATFRRRNLFLSGSVMLVLALGVSMAVLLAERARALAERQADFILGVSHELRTPLTVIRVAADNLRKGIVENSEKAHSYGEIIHTQATELSNMIEETLALARMRSEVVRHRSSVAPEQIVSGALADNYLGLRGAGMKVGLDIAPGLPGVEVDLHLIKRCVGNLIQNAVKYAAGGQDLLVRARTAIRRDKEMVEFSVEDRGPGISKDDLPHIFEPFYRGNMNDTSQIPGIGLGLTLVKRAVEDHGGTVEVESGRITRFSIFLPVQYAQTNRHKGA